MARKARIEFTIREIAPSSVPYPGRLEGTYGCVRHVDAVNAENMGLGEEGARRRYEHRWEDGWVAVITARRMRKGERKRRFDGFRGREYMVDRILMWGDTYCRCSWTPDPRPPRDDGSWWRCVYCHTTRREDTFAEVAAREAGIEPTRDQGGGG